MTTIFLTVVIFLEIIEYMIIIDIILSWLSLVGIRFRPKFIASILGPIYAFVRKYIPTHFGAFDFSPIIIILGIWVLRGLIISVNPEVQLAFNQLFGK